MANQVGRWFVVLAVVALVVAAGIVIARTSGNAHGRQVSNSTSQASDQNHATHNSKQLWTCGMHPQVVQDHPGNCPICRMKLTPMRSEASAGPTGESSESAHGNKKILYWWDPMLGPASISDKPGKSAMGMDLVPVYAGDASAGPRVTIDPTVVQNMGVRTAPVTRGPLEVTVRAVGMIK